MEKISNNSNIINLDNIEETGEKIYENFIINPSESDIVNKYGRILNEKVIGQEKAKKAVLAIIEQILANLVIREDGYNKPIASLLFAGPSGVGKTKIAKIMQIALNEFFQENNEIIKINCADYQGEQPFSITRLIGASAGYIGSNMKPKFHPDNIKGKGRIILFDEIEKAGTPLKNILLSILDDGEAEINYIKDNKENEKLQGKFINLENKGENDTNNNSFIKASFKDKIIILTSNIGLNKIDEEVNKNPIGFTNGKKKNYEEINEDIENIIKKELNNHFKLELQGRFDYIVPFSYFNEEDTKKLIDLQVNNLIKEILEKHGLITIFSKEAKNFIKNNIYTDPEYRKYGGRHIEHYFKKNLILPIAQIINKGNIKGKILFISVKGDNFKFSLIPYSELISKS